MEEFAKRRSAAPTRDSAGVCLFRLVKLAEQGRENVRSLQIIVVVWAIEVRRHGADEIAPILPPISLAHFNPGDFRDGIPFVSRFKRAGEQVFFFERLRGEFWINAGTAQEQEF